VSDTPALPTVEDVIVAAGFTPVGPGPFSIDAFPDDMHGWRCHRCIRYAGPYGSRETAEREAILHQERDHTGDG